MNEINNKLDGLNELITRIDAKILEITTKLDEVIKALHEYDDDQIQYCEYSGLPSVKAYDEKDILSWDVDGVENVGVATVEHYKNEIINKPATMNMDKKKRSGRKYYKPKNK